MSLEQQIEKYKKEKLYFDRYYKYQFFYSNDKIAVMAGGEGNDIYRSELGSEMRLEDIVRECGTEFMQIIEKESTI